MWILKNSKELLEHIKPPNFYHITSTKSFEFFRHFIQLFLNINWKADSLVLFGTPSLKKNGNRRYKYLVLSQEDTYVVTEHSDSKSKYIEDDFIKMLQFLVNNIFVVFVGKVFQKVVVVPMGTNFALF